MRGFLILTLAAFVAVGAAMPAEAAAGYQTRARAAEDDAGTSYSLATIMNNPKPFLEREVMFLCRFAATAKLFQSAAPRLTPAQHANFAAWPDKAILWEAKGRKNVLPTLYLNKNNRDLVVALEQLERYDLVAVTGRVVDIQAGYPCILVSKLEPVDAPREKLTQAVVDCMRQGAEALRIEAGEAAARHFEQAIMLGLPGEYRAKAFEQLAQANLIANRLDLARNCLQQAVAVNRGDHVLHAALADVALRMNLPDEALAHASFALEMAGRFPQAHGIRAEALAALGDTDAASAVIADAASMPGVAPRERAMLEVRRARVNLRAGRAADAASAYAAAIQPHAPLSNDGWLHREIGLFYEQIALQSGDSRHLDSAFDAYERAFRLDRNDAEALYAMMEVEFRRQKLADEPDFSALAALTKSAAKLRPGYAPARILEGRVLFAMGRTGEAEHRYQTVANQVARDPMALIALAEAFVELGKDGAAAATVRRARDIQPWNDRVRAVGTCLEQGVALVKPAKPAVPLPIPPSARPAAHDAPVMDFERQGDLTAADGYPQEIQASVRPETAFDQRLPITRVTIPARSLRKNGEPASRLRPSPEDGVPPAGGEPEAERGAVRDAEPDEDGFIRFGMVAGAANAYASLPVAATDVEYRADADEAKIPRTFSFQPDSSPVLLAEVRSPGKGERDMPVRNANLYRRWAGGRKPAEIIEREPVSPRVGLDTPAMVPPKDGAAHRAEVRIPLVRLPSSSQGIGASGEKRDGR